ncbi:hypothetical protein [Burkholderia guangdongensis]|uniref:hypothetical protein n=1 Tax=Burkholderia guangdongensis TaxID=1792500 RepID=UPI0015CDD9AF|nr:hypothetical protein [Burkholderia guangdongensis]
MHLGTFDSVDPLECGLRVRRIVADLHRTCGIDEPIADRLVEHRAVTAALTTLADGRDRIEPYGNPDSVIVFRAPEYYRPDTR